MYQIRSLLTLLGLNPDSPPPPQFVIQHRRFGNISAPCYQIDSRTWRVRMAVCVLMLPSTIRVLIYINIANRQA